MSKHMVKGCLHYADNYKKSPLGLFYFITLFLRKTAIAKFKIQKGVTGSIINAHIDAETAYN
jgi:hypothetical protein